MIAAICTDQSGRLETPIASMAHGLLNGVRPPSIWCDPNGHFAAASVSAGLLSEDQFDTQPYVDERFCFVADIRLDNRDDIIRELGIPTIEAAVMSDAQLTWHAWLQWGEQLLQRMNGSFSFCVWDRKHRTLFAATDATNNRRLFKAELGHTLLLSSQMNSMLAHPGLPRDLDMEALSLIMAPLALPGRTAYKAVSFLHGGHILTRTTTSSSTTPPQPSTTRPWWNLGEPSSISYKDPRDYVAHALQVFEKAVHARLRASGHVSTAVSGGLDSTLVSAVAAKHLEAQGRKLYSYTSVPTPGLPLPSGSNAVLDESDYVRSLLALHPNMQHTFVLPEMASPLRLMPSIHARSHALLRNTANHLWLDAICNRAKSAGSRVLLGGEHGNFAMSLPGANVISILFGQGRWFRALHLARQDAALGGRSLKNVIREEIGFRFPFLRSPLGLRGGAFLFTETARTNLGSLLRQERLTARKIETMRERATFATHGFGVHSVAQYGVDMRDPTADRFFLETVLSFPIEAFFAGGRSRGLAREMGVGLVPDKIRLRRTVGAQVPEHAALIARDAAAYRHTLSAIRSSPAARDTIDLEAVSTSLETVCSGAGTKQMAASLDRAMDLGIFFLENGV